MYVLGRIGYIWVKYICMKGFIKTLAILIFIFIWWIILTEGEVLEMEYWSSIDDDRKNAFWKAIMTVVGLTIIGWVMYLYKMADRKFDNVWKKLTTNSKFSFLSKLELDVVLIIIFFLFLIVGSLVF